jgi:hypothetical protein
MTNCRRKGADSDERDGGADGLRPFGILSAIGPMRRWPTMRQHAGT